MLRKTIVALTTGLLLLGAPGAALAGPGEDVCVPIVEETLEELGWAHCF